MTAKKPQENDKDQKSKKEIDAELDEALEETFPASDPNQQNGHL